MRAWRNKVQPAHVLDRLRSCSGVRLEDLPGSSGIYALRDHTGAIRYLGLAHSEGFRTRIRNKHVSGSEDRSHKFSAAYNAGRLWRDRHAKDGGDGSLAKRLRNCFILTHCTASVVEITDYGDKAALQQIEKQVISLASPAETVWNRAFVPMSEPAELVDKLIHELRLSTDDCAALDRQKQRYKERAA